VPAPLLLLRETVDIEPCIMGVEVDIPDGTKTGESGRLEGNARREVNTGGGGNGCWGVGGGGTGGAALPAPISATMARSW